MSRRGSRAIEFFSSGYLWLFLTALALRSVYLWQALRHNELLTYPVVDARVYVDWAHEILKGKWLWYEAKTYTPGVPLWLAGWFAVLGERPWLHFVVFHLLGAIQAVVLGKTAEMLWNRRVGLATGWLAALYWPLILFEATYYAEPLACLGLTIALYGILRWQRGPGGVGRLLGAGLALGIALLARANLMLCAPVLALWVMLIAARRAPSRRWVRALAAPALLALPSLAMCAPVVYWNWRVTGVPELRTGGWLSVYLGNNPEYRGLVVPVGVRWSDFIYQPIRAGRVARADQNAYWREQTFRVVRERPAEWGALMARKAAMLVGRFEISQEIDLQKFRAFSSILSAPVWPDWAVLFPLGLVALVAMGRSSEARRGWALLLFAGVYLLSIAPVQAAGRYRLPVVVPLLPLAGWALAMMIERVRRREWREFALPACTAAMAVAAIVPDWLGLRREKIINHDFLVGLKYVDAGDDAGAARAFADGAAWNPNDPDCAVQLGEVALRQKDPAAAEAHFARALELFPRAYEAVLGLGGAALAAGHPDQALGRVEEALRLVPDNQDAFTLRAEAYLAKRDWPALAGTYHLMRGHPQTPASVGFAEARAWILAARPDAAGAVFDELASEEWHAPIERNRARYLAAVLTWRLGDPAAARQRWQTLAAQPPGFFPLLAQTLGGQKPPADLPPNYADEPNLRYALALAAIQRREISAAVTQLEAIVARRQARSLPEADRDVLEIWALEDLARARPPAPP